MKGRVAADNTHVWERGTTGGNSEINVTFRVSHTQKDSKSLRNDYWEVLNRAKKNPNNSF